MKSFQEFINEVFDSTFKVNKAVNKPEIKEYRFVTDNKQKRIDIF